MRAMRMKASMMYGRVRKRRKRSTRSSKQSNMLMIGAALVAVWYFFIKKK
jgi:hypothetical protein